MTSWSDCYFMQDLFQRFINGAWGKGCIVDVLQWWWVPGDLNSSLLIFQWGSYSPWFLIKWYDIYARFWSALLHLEPSWSKSSQDQQLPKNIFLFKVRVLADSSAWCLFCLVFRLQLLGFCGATEPSSRHLLITVYVMEILVRSHDSIS